MRNFLRRNYRRFFPRKNPALRNLSPVNQKLVKKIRSKNLSYLTDSRLISIINSIQTLNDEKIPGIFLEVGCALGGSTILISSLKDPQTLMNVYDVFEMIPPPTDDDGEDVLTRYKTISSGKSKGLGNNKYYGYEENLFEKVKGNLRTFDVTEPKNNVHLIKGLVQDTVDIDGPVAFAHIDVDWYEPVMTCLKRIVPHLSTGGVLILDDYQDWSGCRKATDEYFENIKPQFHMDISAGSMKITRLVEA